MFDQILLPVDGSTASEQATEHALVLAGTYDATVNALFVLDRSIVPNVFEGDSDDEQIETELRETAQSVLDSVIETCENVGVPVTSTIRVGHPTEEILEAISNTESNLVVLGSHPRGRLARFLRRSIVEQVANEAQVPVLTVRDSAEDVASGYRGILLAIDGSDSSRQAGTYAFDLADAYDATVYGIHVVETRFGRSEPIQSMLEQQGEKSIQDARVRAARAGVELVPTVREGDPGREILDFAAKQDIDLIVLGTHGRAGFDRVVMGSVASDIIREAERAVLTVRMK